MGGQVDLQHVIRRAAVSFPRHLGVHDGSYALHVGSLVAAAERFANALDATGVPPRAAIGILSENRSEYVVADLGIALARRVRVALNARLQIDDHRFIVADADVRALVHSSAYAAEAEVLRKELGLVTISFDGGAAAADMSFAALLERSSDVAVDRVGSVEDAAWITYTAGTTGSPKGVVLSRRAIREVAFNLLLELGPVRPGGEILLPQALSHGAGFFVLPWLLSGAALRVLRRFDPGEIVALGARGAGRTLKCVPAMLPPLMEAAASRQANFDSIVYGASPISRPVLEASLDRFGPILTQIYGQSEAPATITCLQASDHVGDGEQRFSAGRPWRNVAVEIRDPSGAAVPAGVLGEVYLTGPHLMTGYHQLPELTAETLRDGWIRTRDYGCFDEDGFLHLRGRMDDMIVSGGYNISPAEVEQVLCRIPGIEEVSVVGLPDERWGTVVAALVKPSHNEQISGEDVIAAARLRLGFRCPKIVKVVGDIPRTTYGKVDRKRVLAIMNEPVDSSP